MGKIGNNFATNGGQAAGRDIHNNLNLHLGISKPESQMQAEFFQRTGIWCPKPAREWLEQLMEYHRFTAKELTVAWKAGSLAWRIDQDEQKIMTPWFEAAFAYGVVALMSVYFLAWALLYLFNSRFNTPAGAFMTFGGGAMFLAVCWMTNRFMLWPRRVALRVRRVSQDMMRNIVSNGDGK